MGETCAEEMQEPIPTTQPQHHPGRASDRDRGEVALGEVFRP